MPSVKLIQTPSQRSSKPDSSISTARSLQNIPTALQRESWKVFCASPITKTSRRPLFPTRRHEHAFLKQTHSSLCSAVADSVIHQRGADRLLFCSVSSQCIH